MTETVLFYITLFTYLAAAVVTTTAWVMKVKEATRRAGHYLFLLAACLHTVTLAARWASGGHMPVTDIYELNLSGAWLTGLLCLLFRRLKRLPAMVEPFVLLSIVLVLGQGFLHRTEAGPMGPAHRSPWLVVHVLFAWLAFGCFVIATAEGVLLLLRSRLLAARPGLKMPDAGVLDEDSYRFVALGFINHAVMLVSGAMWAKALWGHYWNWDPLETWSLITFLFYAFYLHARSFMGWKGRRTAWLAVVGMAIVVVSFWGVNWFAPSIHPGP